MNDAIKALLSSLPTDAVPGRYKASPGWMSEAIVRHREPGQDITVGAQVVAWCENDATRVLLAAAPALRDALTEAVAEVDRLRGDAERERARVVAWLRAEAKHYSLYIDQRRCELRADAIERGEHRREEKE